MKVFTAHDTTDMALQVYEHFTQAGQISTSRNGPVLSLPYPVTMEYTKPWARGNFTPYRDANPFFHMMEGAWMLAGRRDVRFLTYYNKNMVNYSDDGKTFNAAYGYRIRHHFGYDQLMNVTAQLSNYPDTRQAVIQIWDPADHMKDTVDKACNMSIVFTIAYGRLDMMVYNRSNDAVYGGVTGANPIHFSFFHQWVADQLNMQMGTLRFVSANLHIYTELYPHWDMLQECMYPQAYPEPGYCQMGSLSDIEEFCDAAIERTLVPQNFRSMFVNFMLVPIHNSWAYHKRNEHIKAMRELEGLKCPQLLKACESWLFKRAR